MKTPWRDGTTHVVYEPPELLEKLAALTPAPRAHLVRFQGVLAPAAKWRPLVVPAPTEKSSVEKAAEESACAHAHEEAGKKPRRRRNYFWSELLKRVFAIDILECPRHKRVVLARAGGNDDELLA